MGNKPTRKWKRFLLHLAVGLMGVFLVGGCATGQVIHSPASPTSAPAIHSQDSPASAAAQHLSQGEFLLLSGDYEAAQRQSCILLEQYAGQADDQALFLAGLVWIHPDNPNQNNHLADICFGRVVDQHPDSPLVAASETWRAMIGRMEEKEQMIERLAKVSLALEKQLKAEKDNRLRLEERLQKMKAIDLNQE
jgi:hypothetical protein